MMNEGMKGSCKFMQWNMMQALKQQRILIICNNTDGRGRRGSKWDTSGRGRRTLPNSTYMWYQQRANRSSFQTHWKRVCTCSYQSTGWERENWRKVVKQRHLEVTNARFIGLPCAAMLTEPAQPWDPRGRSWGCKSGVPIARGILFTWKPFFFSFFSFFYIYIRKWVLDEPAGVLMSQCTYIKWRCYVPQPIQWISMSIIFYTTGENDASTITGLGQKQGECVPKQLSHLHN